MDPKKTLNAKGLALSENFGLRRLVLEDCVRHQEVRANRRDFPRSEIACNFVPVMPSTLRNTQRSGVAPLQHEREFRTFADELIDRNWKESLNYVRQISLATIDVQVCVLNSCTIAATEWREYGYVGTGGIDAIRTLARMPIARPTFRFIALHHHLLPVAEVEVPASRGATLALDASIILAEAQAAGVHVALHGHQHKVKLATYMNLSLRAPALGSPIHVVSSGSAGAVVARLPNGENNTYCVFTVEGGEAQATDEGTPHPPWLM